MTPREVEEYRALRDTIRERGNIRHWVIVVGLGVWAALVTANMAIATVPIATLLSLAYLVAVFEVVLSLHTGVERVGRYIQVFFEADGAGGQWEHVAMEYGRTFPGGGIDALLSPVFLIAALLNFMPVTLSGPAAIDWLVTGGVHVLFGVRVWSARRRAGRQRALDLQRFTTLRDRKTQE